jgi:hypothetical protein
MTNPVAASTIQGSGAELGGRLAPMEAPLDDAAAVPMPAPEGRRLADRYRFVRPGDSGLPPERIARLWIDEGALSAERARARVDEVVLLALDEDEVVGVSTAWLQENPHLRMTLWNYRTFVARAHREGDIAFLLLHATRDELAARYADGTDVRASGMIMEVQNELLKRYRNHGVWRTSRFAFIGEDERGAHHRVFYFEGARAPTAPTGR